MQQFWKLFLFGFGLFEASLLFQLLQLFLLTNESNSVPFSDCTCLELAPGAVVQEWMNVSHLAEKVLSVYLFCLFHLPCIFDSPSRPAETVCSKLCCSQYELEDQKIFVP